jgi:drug/metabolite transporter superfamily protein YnfA
MPISAISQQREAYGCYKPWNWLPAGNAAKLSAMDVNGLPAVSWLQRAPHGNR